MTDDIALADGDFRRAAALLTHYSNNSSEGVEAVIAEADEAGRLRQLCVTLPAVMAGVQDGWHTPTTTAVMEAFTRSFAAREAGAA